MTSRAVVGDIEYCEVVEARHMSRAVKPTRSLVAEANHVRFSPAFESVVPFFASSLVVVTYLVRQSHFRSLTRYAPFAT